MTLTNSTMAPKKGKSEKATADEGTSEQHFLQALR
jgi:hypothetical protein